ncbi:endonuclease/exonuclease/phosphatase family protein [Confluentibacter citreus]|uniref:endonuclease/exonuclease/phosphatase family protein n=1 Tax=Confluentibacter citreus TaxID=2007307 RepID=UPI000C282E4B|nr:endonuclease/exonuclease/phosphatase family protein [Confluentibacter citreus]
MLKILRSLFLFINVIVILALLTIHFIIRDNGFYEPLLFYIFPLPIIIGIILFFSLFIGKKRRKYNLILAGILLFIWLGRSFKINFSDDISEADLEVVFWNASRDNNFKEAFFENKGIPDILVLVEPKITDINSIKQRFSNHYIYDMKGDIYLFSKTPVIIEKEVTSKRNSTVVNFKSRDIDFYAVDAQGSPDLPRRGEMQFIDSHIDKTNNTVILGDFNLPYESGLFKNIKKNFNQAFNEKGNGFRETWFWNIPLLSIDHIWVSKDLKVLKTEKIGTFKSDHSMLKTYIKR